MHLPALPAVQATAKMNNIFKDTNFGKIHASKQQIDSHDRTWNRGHNNIIFVAMLLILMTIFRPPRKYLTNYNITSLNEKPAVFFSHHIHPMLNSEMFDHIQSALEINSVK